MNEPIYTNRDIEIAEKLGGLQALQETTLNVLKEYCADNKIQHKAMWQKLDSHSKKINWFMGAAAVIGSAFGYAFFVFRGWFHMKGKV